MILRTHQSSCKESALCPSTKKIDFFFFSSLSSTLVDQSASEELKCPSRKRDYIVSGIISLPIALTQSPPFHQGNNHIKIKYNFLRNLIINREIITQYCCKVGDEIAYIFIKSLEKWIVHEDDGAMEVSLRDNFVGSLVSGRNLLEVYQLQKKYSYSISHLYVQTKENYSFQELNKKKSPLLIIIFLDHFLAYVWVKKTPSLYYPMGSLISQNIHAYTWCI